MAQIYRSTIIGKEFLLGDRDSNVSFASVDEQGNVSFKMQIPKVTPVNAVASKLDIPATTMALILATHTLTFDGVEYEKVGGGAAGNQWVNVAGLAALINATEDWAAVEDNGALKISAAVKGAAFNGVDGVISTIEATTANGDVAVKATATIAAATLAELAVGDVVSFDGIDFVKAAVTSAPDNEWADQAGLITCIDAMADWTAADNAGAIDITAAENGADKNGKAIMLTINRETASGVNGTKGTAGDVIFDSGHVYVCTADNTIADANWKSAALA